MNSPVFHPARMDNKPSKVAFRSVKLRRVFEEIILQIRRELTLGNLRPGDKLPAERDLAKQFGTSRTAVREALRTLENAGNILSRKGVKGGVFVREADPCLLTRLLGDMIDLGSISLASLTEARVHILAIEAAYQARQGSSWSGSVGGLRHQPVMMRQTHHIQVMRRAALSRGIFGCRQRPRSSTSHTSPGRADRSRRA